MEPLKTIQTQEKLNNVFCYNQNAYSVCSRDLDEKNTILFQHDIKFQKGPRNEADSVHGLIDSDLLEIVRHRLQGFQEGPYANKYNERALKHVERALVHLNRRTEDRIKRNVLGTYNK